MSEELEICVQYSDESHSKIISYFGGPQDPDVYPNQGVTTTSDPLYHEFFNNLPFLHQMLMPQPT
ncbi:TPA: hypothetical protein R4S08_000796 [Kluyvera ascorbata]|nr:hypothetical protein [Kluyvera ascorbata]